MSRPSIKILLNSCLHPSLMKILLRDLFGIKYEKSTNLVHLEAAMEWLKRSQDHAGCDGSSAAYSLYAKWDPPYPETTGYIISTFLRFANFSGDQNFVDRAIKMGDWEIDIQLPSGAVRGGVGINDYPIVFNTGMVILGWADLFGYTNDQRYLSAAVRAADWLCDIMDEDGKWSKFEYNNTAHAYCSRVSWSLLEVYKHTGNIKYKDAAIKNINWVLAHTDENAWIENMGFIKDEVPFTHTIAYTLRGLLESSSFFEEELKTKTRDVVFKAAEKVLLKYERNKKNPNAFPEYLHGNFNNQWKSNANFSCLTGNAQFSIIWLKIFQITGDARFLNAALKIIDQLKELHDLKSSNDGIRGAIGGSFPIWGSYMPYYYPNWATKFFADAIMLQENILKEIEK